MIARFTPEDCTRIQVRRNVRGPRLPWVRARAERDDRDVVTKLFGKVFGQESLEEAEPMVRIRHIVLPCWFVPAGSDCLCSESNCSAFAMTTCGAHTTDAQG